MTFEYQDMKFPDAELHCRDKIFLINRGLFSYQSELFNQLAEMYMKESPTHVQIIIIPDRYTPESLDRLLCCLPYQKIKEDSKDVDEVCNTIELYEYLQMTDEHILETLLENLEVIFLEFKSGDDIPESYKKLCDLYTHSPNNKVDMHFKYMQCQHYEDIKKIIPKTKQIKRETVKWCVINPQKHRIHMTKIRYSTLI